MYRQHADISDWSATTKSNSVHAAQQPGVTQSGCISPEIIGLSQSCAPIYKLVVSQAAATHYTPPTQLLLSRLGRWVAYSNSKVADCEAAATQHRL